MSWLGFVLVILGIWLAFKVAGVVLRLIVTVLILIAAYWWLAPVFGWPTLGEVIYVLGPDVRLPEVALPALELP
ncbi:hypothetical protein CMZ82_16625 [Lysobacteraceae bacterium NML93-0792]|nr:hypothetical protein CMZ82_16625 [Xanthomonadaceae bacterium NML93-0792]PBS14320.1 hypothetical protein CMZ81_16625 [Xanthomonadaceae bacterium NML93-0793]PBS17534.1 hypothetical protein CMZ80_16675 [Xanthomonadaceae bacterium NML93-0831]